MYTQLESQLYITCTARTLHQNQPRENRPGLVKAIMNYKNEYIAL